MQLHHDNCIICKDLRSITLENQLMALRLSTEEILVTSLPSSAFRFNTMFI